MLNNCVLMGRLKELEIKENNGVKMGIMYLSTPKSDKENVILEIVLYENMINNMEKYCDKGDLVGIKGKIDLLDNKTTIIAEKITYLSTRKDN